MPSISPLFRFQCILGGMLTAIPIPNKIIDKNTAMSPMTMTNIAFIGAGVCPVTGIPTPCVPAVLPWLLASTKLIIGGMPAIVLGRSMAICARGGVIMAIPTGKPTLIISG